MKVAPWFHVEFVTIIIFVFNLPDHLALFTQAQGNFIYVTMYSHVFACNNVYINTCIREKDAREGTKYIWWIYSWNATKYETRNVNVGRQGHENEPINEWGDDGLHACKWNVRGHLKFTFYCFPVKTQLLQNTTFYIRL